MLKGLLVILIIGLLWSVRDARGGLLEAGQQCSYRDVRLSTSCLNSFGFSSTTSLTVNVTALIDYCSASGRTNGEHCVQQFPETCPLIFLTEDSSTFRRRQQLTSNTLDYMCSNIDVLENNIDCVQNKMDEVRRCGEESLVQYATQLSSAGLDITLDLLEHIMKESGQITEGCFVDTLRKDCESDVSTLLGNFLYGILIYPYED